MYDRPQSETSNAEEGIFSYDSLMEDTYVLEQNNHPAFAKQYQQATEIVCDIVWQAAERKSQKERLREEHQRHVNNIIPLMGERGTGKTSAMRSFRAALERFNGDDEKSDPVFPYRSLKLPEDKKARIYNASFIPIDIINAGDLKASDSILEIVLARMKNVLKKGIDPELGTLSQGSLEELRRLLQKCETLYRNLRYLYSENRGRIPEGESSLRALENLSSSQSVIWEFEELVEDYLDFFDHKWKGKYGQIAPNSFLVIALDDVDRYADESGKKDACTLLETIYAHLTLPRVIVLMTADEKMLRSSISNHLEKTFHITDKNELKKQTRQLISKILPAYHCIYMPNFEHDIWMGVDDKKSKIYVQLPQVMEEELKLESGKPISAKKLSLYLLAGRTGSYFDATGESQHFFEYRNIRRLHDFLRDLDSLQPVSAKDADVDTIETKNRQSLSVYLTEAFPAEKLDDQEFTLYGRFQRFPIDQRSQEILNYIRKELPEQKDQSSRSISVRDATLEFLHNEPRPHADRAPYSYGELIRNLYLSSREGVFSEEMVHCILASYSVELNQCYADFCRLPEGDELKAKLQNRLVRFLGSSISGRWSNQMLPKVNSSWKDQLSEKKTDRQVENFWSHSEANFDRVFAFALSEAPDNTESIKRFVHGVEMLFMFYTDWFQPYEEQMVSKLHISIPEDVWEEKAKQPILEFECSDTLCFNVLNFCVNSFQWKRYFDWIDKKIIDALMEYFKRIQMPKDVISQIRKEIPSYSMRSEYEQWSSTYGPFALPLHQFDLTYNLLRRLANEMEDKPHCISEDSIIRWCVWLYDKIADKLEEQSEQYKGFLPENQRFEDIFRACPFVQRMKLLTKSGDLQEGAILDKAEQNYTQKMLNVFFKRTAQNTAQVENV